MKPMILLLLAPALALAKPPAPPPAAADFAPLVFTPGKHTAAKGVTVENPLLVEAPLTTTTAMMLAWNPPHGTYLQTLHDAILKTDAAGDIAERDRLLARYQPWAGKYLNPDSATWSRDKLLPGGKPAKQTETQPNR